MQNTKEPLAKACEAHAKINFTPNLRPTHLCVSLMTLPTSPFNSSRYALYHFCFNGKNISFLNYTTLVYYLTHFLPRFASSGWKNSDYAVTWARINRRKKKKTNLLTNLVQFASWDGAVPEWARLYITASTGFQMCPREWFSLLYYYCKFNLLRQAWWLLSYKWGNLAV